MCRRPPGGRVRCSSRAAAASSGEPCAAANRTRASRTSEAERRRLVNTVDWLAATPAAANRALAVDDELAGDTPQRRRATTASRQRGWDGHERSSTCSRKVPASTCSTQRRQSTTKSNDQPGGRTIAPSFSRSGARRRQRSHSWHSQQSDANGSSDSPHVGHRRQPCTVNLEDRAACPRLAAVPDGFPCPRIAFPERKPSVAGQQPRAIPAFSFRVRTGPRPRGPVFLEQRCPVWHPCRRLHQSSNRLASE